jgi:hypothetical protein
MYWANLSYILYCLDDSVANHSHFHYSCYFNGHPTGYVISYKTFIWLLEQYLCNIGNLWLVYQFYCLPLVLSHIFPLHHLSMRPFLISDDSIEWFFNHTLIQIGEQLCCLTMSA